MMKDKIYGVRDAYGNRPLCIGKIVPVDSGRRKFDLNFCEIFLKFNLYFPYLTLLQYQLKKLQPRDG